MPETFKGKTTNGEPIAVSSDESGLWLIASQGNPRARVISIAAEDVDSLMAWLIDAASRRSIPASQVEAVAAELERLADKNSREGISYQLHSAHGAAAAFCAASEMLRALLPSPSSAAPSPAGNGQGSQAGDDAFSRIKDQVQQIYRNTLLDGHGITPDSPPPASEVEAGDGPGVEGLVGKLYVRIDDPLEELLYFRSGGAWCFMVRAGTSKQVHHKSVDQDDAAYRPLTLAEITALPAPLLARVREAVGNG